MGIPSTAIEPACPVNEDRVDRRIPLSSIASAPALRNSPSVMTNCVDVRFAPVSTTDTVTPGPCTGTVPAAICACVSALRAACTRACASSAALRSSSSSLDNSPRRVRRFCSWVLNSSSTVTRSCSDRPSRGSDRCARTCVANANPTTMKITSMTTCNPRGSAKNACFARVHRRGPA